MELTVGASYDEQLEYCRELTWEFVQGKAFKDAGIGGHVRVNSTTQAFYGPDGEVYTITITPTQFNSLGEAYERLTTETQT